MQQVDGKYPQKQESDAPLRQLLQEVGAAKQACQMTYACCAPDCGWQEVCLLHDRLTGAMTMKDS